MSDCRKLDELPPEIFHLILGFLPHSDLSNVASVCRKLYTAATCPKFWQTFKFIHTDPTKLKYLMKMKRFSTVKSLVVKRSVKRTMWTQVGPKLGLAVLKTVVGKFEELDLSGVDLSKKQVGCLFDIIFKSPRTVLKKLRIFCKFDFIPPEVFGKSLCSLEEVDLGYHRVKESHQQSLFENMGEGQSRVKKLVFHDNTHKIWIPYWLQMR